MVNGWVTKKCLYALVLLLLCAIEGLSDPKNDSLLQELRVAIEQKDRYVLAKLKRIEKLNKTLRDLPHQNASTARHFDVYNDLYHEYKIFIYDSAFKYAQKLIETSYRLRDPSRSGYARVKLGFVLISSGMFKETFDSLNVVDTKQLPDSTRIEYHTLMARAFYDLASYDNDRFFHDVYTTWGNRYMDSALSHCQRDTYQYLYISGLKSLKSGDPESARRNLEQLLGQFELTYQQRAVNYHNLSYAYKSLGDDEKAVSLMVEASLADIAAATKETAAMYTLAKLLYEKGDLKHAYIFIEQAMADALYYGARQRKVEIGSILPTIAAAKLNNVEEQKTVLLTYSAAITALSALVLIFVLIIFKQLRKIKIAKAAITQANNSLMEINHRLRESDTIKEEYIGYYFTINSEYIDKMETIRNGVDTKLTAKKYDDIRFIVNNINLKRERETLYAGFDKTFLKLFPDFVTTFNSYFDEKDRILLKDGELLNTELRIFALIRMGVSDTEKIARILGYSVNTIYAYKTRIRNKSLLPNEEFDKKIMGIKTV
jgi:hypothetical protein